MRITIDLDDPIPPFNQLVGQIKQAVASGALAPGDPLPSIRQLANDLDLNQKTVAKAYRLLERDRVIQPRGYRGSFVHPEARAHAEFDLQGWMHKQLTACVSALRDRGATDPEIRVAFNNLMANRGPEDTRHD